MCTGVCWLWRSIVGAGLTCRHDRCRLLCSDRAPDETSAPGAALGPTTPASGPMFTKGIRDTNAFFRAESDNVCGSTLRLVPGSHKHTHTKQPSKNTRRLHPDTADAYVRLGPPPTPPRTTRRISDEPFDAPLLNRASARSCLEPSRPDRAAKSAYSTGCRPDARGPWAWAILRGRDLPLRSYFFCLVHATHRKR